ncbi:nicotinate-nucleotide adenylyltransferase [Thalassolituus alkanivorans]|uniref:nicotinate-nucleotide adenylyltransferase n=1 Tax=Thalassolituus alkanivorans TaxID=2881055 RepID=UPI001E5704D1|nr:nicotinate-nucleotide adenylyltransferase [Thalassolituus alkanivorans]MCB2388594.1 nicotinate-nucleotide adenylyltransferase [Thalassolituus alkanivorans]MCB2423687.1 nicotinate-nucleotide adenylyltransferase [Thalassolituus alkanivorans]
MAKSVNKPPATQPTAGQSSGSRRKRWALLGGTFDPVHIGHLRIAVQLRDLGFEKVLLIPNRIPPHRPQPQASAEQRLAMLLLACRNLDGIEPSNIELERDDLSYSAITVAALRAAYPDVGFTWVMGQDAWQGFEHWHQPQSLLDEANLLVISRPGLRNVSHWQEQQLEQRECSLTDLLAAEAGHICLHHWPELDISASDLRRAIKQGDNVTFLTPDAVLDYITQQQLYR